MKKLMSLLLALMLAVCALPLAVRAAEAPNDEAEDPGTATVTLSVPEVLFANAPEDGAQLVLDSGHSTWDESNMIANVFWTSDFQITAEQRYAMFDHTIPEHIKGTGHDQQITPGNSKTITIPAGIYDFYVCLPDGNYVLLAYENNIPGGMDDFKFEAGHTYLFEVAPNYSENRVVVTLYDNDKLYVPADAPRLENGWNFETDPESDGWEMYDHDGDERNWLWLRTGLYLGQATIPAHSGKGLMLSESWDAYTQGELRPDNVLVTPKFKAGVALTAYMRSWRNDVMDNIFIYANVDGTDEWQLIDSFENMPFVYNLHITDTKQFEGKEIRIAFRHFQSDNMMFALLDDVQIIYDEADIPVEAAPTMPPAGEAQITLSCKCDLSDGFAMLLDWDHDTYDRLYVNQPVFSYGGGYASVFSEFELTIPENAVGEVNSPFLMQNGDPDITITIDAGVYDYAIVNPDSTVNGIYLVSDLGDIAAAYNNYVFEAGKHYTFTIVANAVGNALLKLDITDIDPDAPKTDVPNTQVPDTQAPNTQVPDTQAPDTQAPNTDAPVTETPAPAVQPGDTNGDGYVSVSDALLTMRNVMGLADLDGTQHEAADMNGDGRVDLDDALFIARIAMGIAEL